MRKRKFYQLLYSFFAISSLALVCASCTCNERPQLSEISLIPLPVEIIGGEDAFKLSAEASVIIQNNDEEILKIASYIAELIRPATGFAIEIKKSEADLGNGNIIIKVVEDEILGNEGYSLVVDNNNVLISANKPEGLFRGVQTLRQLLPVSIEEKTIQNREWFIPACTISDYPRFEYRGAMLDVCRHFFSVEDVKIFIDYLATYKMNILHMHLSDDQGWRIEIKSWPNLTAHGGKTKVGGGEGGFYTQDQFAEIVQYAKDRYITIIPEIDMPGHTNAALASYPELNENGIATELYTGTKVGLSSLATRKEITYEFIGDVIRELADLIPGEYIHIGGDESSATQKDDYIYFINRVQEIVTSYGKKNLGWDEIATATMLNGSIAQHWASVENAKLAIEQGAKIILSPASRIYLDMKYDSTSVLGLHWAGYIEVDKAYNWDPAQLIPGIDEENIVGVEAPLWTETVENIEDIQFLVFPKLPGVAEIGWSSASMRDWDTYKIRLGKQAERFKAMKINFYKSPKVPWICNE